jgi:hypothetical protein
MRYPNMSYCMCQNTLLAMNQLVHELHDNCSEFLNEMSSEEKTAFEDLQFACKDFLTVTMYTDGYEDDD